MPRTRSRSQSHELPTDYTNFRSKLNEWFQDIFADVDPKTGYLVKEPTGFYGSKVRSLVRYVYMQSSEVKAIQTSQQIRASSICLYVFHIVKYLSEYILPALFSFLSAYLYYMSADPILVHSVPVFSSTNTTVEQNTTHSWYFPSVSEAGAFIGEVAHNALSIPISFLANTVDRTLHLREGFDVVQTNSQKLFWTPLIAIGVYISTFVLLKCLLNMQHLVSAQWALWNYQALFLKETEEAVERAITGIVRPYLVNTYEQLLLQSSESQLVDNDSRNAMRSLFLTYHADMELYREGLHERIFQYIRAIPFAEILVLGKLSKRYMAGLYTLIRDSNDQLSSILFEFNQQLLQVAPNPKRFLTNSYR
jgi:hypothetical protein